MKNLILSFFLIGFSNAFSSQSWKSAGEYFENQYLNGLQDQLKESDLCIGKPPSLLPLKQAFLIYQLEAQKGDVDAQFRLGMYEKAAVGGHEYANLYMEALKDQENSDSGAFCSFHTCLLLSGKKTKTNSLHHIESLALLGNTECMLALGRHQRSQYWLQRAILAAPSREFEGEASYELGLILQKDELCHPKLLLSRMERAARCEHGRAVDWLKMYRTNDDGILAYSQFLQDLGQPIYAEAVLKGLSGEPRNSDTWSAQDRYRDNGATTALDLYSQAVAQALSEPSDVSHEFTLNTIRELLITLPKESRLVDTILTLYESAASLEVTQNNQILELETSWVSSITTLEQLDRALKLRRLLVKNGDISKLDIALQELLNKYDSSDEAFLKLVLEAKSQDLSLFFFKKIFANELSQLEISMQLEDLFSGVGWVYPGKSQTLKALEILASVGSDKVSDFPKLNSLRQNGFQLGILELTPETALFAEGILALNRYVRAYQQHQKTGFYFWDYGLEATLSSQHIEAAKNHVSSMTQRLSGLNQEFRQHRNDINWLKDSANSKQLTQLSLESSLQLKKAQLKKDITELLATQKTLSGDLDHDGLYAGRREELKNSNGLKLFQTQELPKESHSFDVFPRDAQASNWFSHHSIELEKNEVLNIHVNGEWSPTCALERSKLEGIEKATFGPEGFRVQFAEGDSKASGNEQRNSTSQYSSESTTTSAGLSASGAAYGLGFSASISSQRQTGTSKVSEQSKYKQSSNFKTKTAAFQAGYRSKDAPYPDFPAGSYLAVVVSREIKNFAEIIDVFIMGTHSSYVAPQKSVVYFVVNDCNDGKLRQGKLGVKVQKLKPASDEVDKMMDLMIEELLELRTAGDKLVQEGGDLSSRIQHLKTKAVSNAQKNTIIDIRSEPTLQIVFQDWLDNEGDKIVRKARILELSRNIMLCKLEMGGISKQLGVGGEHSNHISSRLSALVKHVKHFRLYDSLLETIQTATRYLLPILHLYYPNGKSFLNGNHIHSDFANDGDDFALETMSISAERLIAQLVLGLNTRSLLGETGKYIILRIPRPGTRLDEFQKESLPLLSDERSRILWDHLFNETFDPNSWGLKMGFRDLYQKTIQSGLDRTEEAPIIVDMALLFGLDEFSAVTRLQRQLHTATTDLYVDREQNYPMLAGPEKLVITDEALLKYTISLGFVCSEEQVLNAVDRIKSDVSTNLNTAKGLSPFTAFRFGVENRKPLENIRTSLGTAEDGYPNHLKDVFLIMKVVSSTHGKPMKWIQ